MYSCVPLTQLLYQAEAVSHPEFSGITQIQAEVLTWNEVISTYEKVFGKKFERINRGSLESLKKAVDEGAKTGNLFATLPTGESVMAGQYLVCILLSRHGTLPSPRFN
jgi:hypothetical protein